MKNSMRPSTLNVLLVVFMHYKAEQLISLMCRKTKIEEEKKNKKKTKDGLFSEL